MSQLFVDNIKNRTGGAIGAPSGIVVTGVGTFSGNLSVGGTITYEDVTNIDSIGIITARSDVSIADKIIHTGDTNTAIRFPAADTFTVETAGSERLRITSAGRFGFNTNNPGVTIHAEDAQAELQVKSTTGTNSAGFRMIPGGQTNALYMYADGSRNINFDDHATSMISIRAGGGGITFNGDTAAANALDDYEEGTFTPVLQVNSDPAGITYSSQGGWYTKIGNVVHINIRLQTTNNGSNTGGVRIAGLPFTVRNSNSVLKAFTFTASGLSGEVSPWATVNTTDMPLYYGLGTYTSFTDANWTNNGDMHITGYYYTD